MGLRCLLPECFSYGRELPMASAVTAASVEAAATANRATAAYCATATNCAASANRSAVESTSDCYVGSAATVAAGNCTTAPAITAVPAVASAITGPSPIAGASVEPAMEPRARADEYATGEVARAVVTVRRARVWVVPVVAVGAYGSRSNIPRSDSDAHYNALGASVRR
jgi:hypothetical protein